MKDWIIVTLLLGVVSGCASPPTHFYSLDVPSVSSTLVRQGPRVMLEPVTLPAALDRPQLVLDNGNGQLSLQEFEHWSAPLDRLLTQNLAFGISQRSGVASVYAYPQAGMSMGELRYVLDIRRLSLQPGRQVRLEAVWQLLRVEDGTVIDSGVFNESHATTRNDIPSLNAALIQLLGLLADNMAQGLVKLG
ncbi:membrane integrity-associated transporter subunit PqiC [Chromobacterium sp. ASV23]|uniref:PqiC family protein n=1 Tax=Chromobacterium sp. ASV23 TaxID=2795110 RepID=UPI0018EDF7A8|nr:PqiC family protein [Chromobacterium sp. ASV23]